MDASSGAADASTCWDCGKPIDAGDHYCRNCGRGQGGYAAWYYHHWGIIVSTIFGLGPFGLFLVWRSPVLTSRARWAYTVLIAIGTGFIGYRFYQFWLLARAVLGIS